MKSDIKTLKDFCIWFNSNKQYKNDHDRTLNLFKQKYKSYLDIINYIERYTNYYNIYGNRDKRILDEDISEITNNFIKNTK